MYCLGHYFSDSKMNKLTFKLMFSGQQEINEAFFGKLWSSLRKINWTNKSTTTAMFVDFQCNATVSV